MAVARQRARRYRIAALVVLAAGILAAGVVYWRSVRAPDYSDDPSMVGFNRATDRQMGLLYGKQGQLIEDLNNSLQEPGTQAIIILAAAAIVAGACAKFARIVEWEAEDHANENSPPEDKIAS